MAIALTVPESYPSSPEARIISLGANIETRTLVIVAQVGRVVNGKFAGAREVRFEFTADTSPSFIDVVNAVPEFRDLRKALETYLVSLGRFAGTVS